MSLEFSSEMAAVVLCVVFLLWFSFRHRHDLLGFPGVSAGDRPDRSPELDPAKIIRSPMEAAEKSEYSQSTEVRLNSFDGRPVSRFTAGGGRVLAAGCDEWSARILAKSGTLRMNTDRLCMTSSPCA